MRRAEFVEIRSGENACASLQGWIGCPQDAALADYWDKKANADQSQLNMQAFMQLAVPLLSDLSAASFGILGSTDCTVDEDQSYRTETCEQTLPNEDQREAGAQAMTRLLNRIAPGLVPSALLAPVRKCADLPEDPRDESGTDRAERRADPAAARSRASGKARI
jgi:hypothetical protein